MVNNRYTLVETLFSNVMGSLHRARDRYPLFGQVDVLLHFLPGHAFRHTSMNHVLDQLQAKASQVNLPLLEVLDGGSAGDHVYFVMRVPSGWTLSVLPVVSGKPTRLHVQAQAMTVELMSHHLVSEGLEPQFFLVSPDGELNVLGTALIPELASLRIGSGSLLSNSKPAKPIRLFPLLLLCSTGVLAAAGYGLYQGEIWQSVVGWPEPVVMLDKAPVVSMLDTSPTSRIPDTVPETLDAPQVAAGSAVSELGVALVEAPPADRSRPAGASVQAIRGLVVDVLHGEPDDPAVPVLSMPAMVWPPVRVMDRSSPVVPDIELAAEESPADTREVNALLLRIKQAINNDHLQAGLYALRALQRKHPKHPQLAVLARGIVVRHRENEAKGISGLSSYLLVDLVKEFGLEKAAGQ